MQDPVGGGKGSSVHIDANDEDWLSVEGRRTGRGEHLGDALLSRRSYAWSFSSRLKKQADEAPRGTHSGLVFERRSFDAEEARTRAMGAL